MKLSRAWRLLLVAALLLQAVLVQTHVHPMRLAAPELSAAGMTGGPWAQPAQQAAAADYCPLCWEAAMAGHFYVPPVVVIPPAPAGPAWAAIFAATAFVLVQPAHGWQSRAPPR